MSNIVDSLLVTLGLDTAEFEKARERTRQGFKNTSDEAKKRGGEVEDSAKKMGMAFAKLKGEVTGLFLAFAGAKSITQFAINTVQATAAAGRSAQVLGMSTNVVNAWGDAIKAAGGDASEAAGVFGKIADIRADFIRNPGNINMPLMGQLGIHDKSAFNDPEALMGHLADQYQAELARAKANGDPNAEGTVQATFRQRAKELLGLSDNWIAMIERGRPALEREIELYKEKDKVTAADAEEARKSIETFNHLQKSLAGLFRSLGGMSIIESLATLIDGFNGTADVTAERTKTLALAFWGLQHPLDSLVAIMANHGLLPKSVANWVIGDDRPPAWMTAPSSTPGALGDPSNQNSAYSGALGDPSNQNSAYSGAAGGGYDTVLGNGRYGSPNQPLTSMTMGQVQDFGTHVLIPRSRAAGVGRDARGLLGSSATGRYQITGSTLAKYAPRLFGANWRNMRYDAAAQDRLGEAIFNDAKFGNLKSIWASLPDARRGAYAGYSWQQMKGLIARGESGGGPVTVNQNFHGPADPRKVQDAAHRGVSHALRKRHRVANANTGVN